MIKRTYETSTLATVTLAALFGFALLPTAAPAAFDSAQLACRQKIAKDGSKLADQAGKAMASCHKLRQKGKVGSGANCNDVSDPAVDGKGKIVKAATKLVDDANSDCTGTPAALLYTGCPSPCDSVVPAITTFQNVADCIVCVVENHAEQVSLNGQGSPTVPMNSIDAKCHAAIGKNQSKFVKTIVKERVKCQNTAERPPTGAMDTSSCIGADPAGKIAKAESKGRSSLNKLCTNADLTNLDSCSFFSLTNLKNCVFDEARVRGRLTFKSFYTLEPGGGITTTTFSSTTTSTTTTIPGGGTQDPECPDLGELTLLAGTGQTCTNNGDCLAGTCDPGLNRCVTVTDLDTGWSGIAHDSDINDHVVTLGNLLCTGPAPTCGLCTLTGINPAGRTCRCADVPNTSFGNRDICDQPFVADADDCGGNICNCYFGGPLPLSAGNTPACVVNRFAQDVSGTADVDAGSGSIAAHLRAQVFLGETIPTPCPACGGTCTGGTVGLPCGVDINCDTKTTCTTNVDCTNPGGTCIASACFFDGVCGNYDPTTNDGIRGGTCYLGRNNALSCDVDSPNETFPAPGGAGHSLDCFPDTGLNVSGAGLKIDILQTTGMQSLSANVSCGFPPSIPRFCPCGECSNDAAVACTSNADCTSPGVCSADAGRGFPNQCDGESCSDIGGGNGQCTTGPDNTSCDAIVRANGEGFISCSSNADCDPANIGVVAGNCTLTKRQKCFLDPIVSQGAANPSTPVGAAIFCIGRTANGGINSVAGLPGPGRVVNQGKSRLFCASNHAVEYQPGVGGCP